MKIELTSADVEALVHALAILVVFRENAISTTSAAGEAFARCAIGEVVLRRIIMDAMMVSPIALAFLAGRAQDLP